MLLCPGFSPPLISFFPNLVVVVVVVDAVLVVDVVLVDAVLVATAVVISMSSPVARA